MHIWAQTCRSQAIERACARMQKLTRAQLPRQKRRDHLVTSAIPLPMPPPSTDWIQSAPMKAVKRATKNLPLRILKCQQCNQCYQCDCTLVCAGVCACERAFLCIVLIPLNRQRRETNIQKCNPPSKIQKHTTHDTKMHKEKGTRPTLICRKKTSTAEGLGVEAWTGLTCSRKSS